MKSNNQVHDPFVEEARAEGKAYIDSFKGDRKALLEDLRRRERASGLRVANLQPKLIPSQTK